MTNGSRAPAPADLALEILDREGAVDRRLPLEALPCEIGRGDVAVACPEDGAMAERAARLDAEGAPGSLRLETIEAESGVWRRVRDRDGLALRAGDQLWLGGQVLVVEADGATPTGWRLRHHGPDGRLRDRVPVPEAGLMIGRRSALVLDASDPGLSRRHAQITLEGGGLRFYDRGARNGSWIRLEGPATLTTDDEFRIGASHFRVVAAVDASDASEAPEAPDGADATRMEPLPPLEAPMDDREATPGLGARFRRLGRRLAADREAGPPGNAEDVDPSAAGPEAPFDSSEDPPADPPPAPLADPDVTVVSAVPDEPEPQPAAERKGPVASEATAAAASGPGASAETVPVVIDAEEGGVTLAVVPGTTILEAARAAGLRRGAPVDWECEDGGCGVCVLAVVEGADRLDPPDPGTGEMKTIQITEQVAPDPARYRLACLARVRGAVRLRKL